MSQHKQSISQAIIKVECLYQINSNNSVNSETKYVDE